MSTYNQSPKSEQVRIGNWFEELRLKQETGCRFYPDPRDREAIKTAGTTARCFVHTEQTFPKDYASVAQEGYVNPYDRVEMKWTQKSSGPRAKLIERQIKEVADAQMRAASEIARKEANRVDYTTEAKAKYHKENFAPALKGDDASIRHFTPHANYIFDTPVTIYSDAMFRGKMVFPSSFVCSSNPFRKNNKFSLPNNENTFKPKAECNERPRPIATPQDFVILHRFRNRLISHVKSMLNCPKGGAIRAIFTTIWSYYMSSNSNNFVLYNIKDILQANFNFIVEPREENSILSSFEAINTTEGISLIDFSMFLRPIPDLRRLELIQDMFKSLNQSTDANRLLERNSIRSKYRGKENVENVLQVFDAIRMSHETMPFASPVKPKKEGGSIAELLSPNSIAGFSVESPPKVSGDGFSIEDFIDYYCDVSAEISDAKEFEAILIETWSV